MATHSSILAWRNPRTEEPGGLQSTGSQRVRHACATGYSTEELETPGHPVTSILSPPWKIHLGKVSIQPLPFTFSSV